MQNTSQSLNGTSTCPTTTTTTAGLVKHYIIFKAKRLCKCKKKTVLTKRCRSTARAWSVWISSEEVSLEQMLWRGCVLVSLLKGEPIPKPPLDGTVRTDGTKWTVYCYEYTVEHRVRFREKDTNRIHKQNVLQRNTQSNMERYCSNPPTVTECASEKHTLYNKVSYRERFNRFPFCQSIDKIYSEPGLVSACDIQ